MTADWKTVSSETAFDSEWLRVQKDKVRLPDGKVIDFFVWDSGDVSVVVPVTRAGKFVIIRQYKHAAKRAVFDFPAGYSQKNEKMEDAAARELMEETGYSCRRLIPIGKLMSHPTKVTGKVYVFLGIDAEKTGTPDFDETEEIETTEITRDKLQEMIGNGEFFVSSSVAAFYMALGKLEE